MYGRTMLEDRNSALLVSIYSHVDGAYIDARVPDLSMTATITK